MLHIPNHEILMQSSSFYLYWARKMLAQGRLIRLPWRAASTMSPNSSFTSSTPRILVSTLRACSSLPLSARETGESGSRIPPRRTTRPGAAAAQIFSFQAPEAPATLLLQKEHSSASMVSTLRACFSLPLSARETGESGSRIPPRQTTRLGAAAAQSSLSLQASAAQALVSLVLECRAWPCKHGHQPAGLLKLAPLCQSIRGAWQDQDPLQDHQA